MYEFECAMDVQVRLCVQEGVEGAKRAARCSLTVR